MLQALATCYVLASASPTGSFPGVQHYVDYHDHPFSVHQQSARHLTTKTSYQPLRIHAHFLEGKIQPTKLELVKAFVNASIYFWGNSLAVVPVPGHLRLPPRCISAWGTGECAAISTTTMCGDQVVIPPEHLASRRACSVCRSFFGDKSCNPRAGSKCTTSKEGEGVPADLILYVTAEETDHCKQGSVAAYASSCSRDQFDRPTAGFVNLCPHAIPTHHGSDKVTATMVSLKYPLALGTAAHEVAHALGFTSSQLPYFRNHSSNPPGWPTVPRAMTSFSTSLPGFPSGWFGEPIPTRNYACPALNAGVRTLPVPSEGVVR